jgi:predicted O-methyltransferase YrrM
MRNYTISHIIDICKSLWVNAGEPVPPIGVPFIDDRLKEYKEKYSGGYPYYSVLRAVVQALKPGVVLEIGTWEGTSAACFADGNPDTTVITIDHHSDPNDDKNQAKTVEVVEKYPNLIYIQGCSTEMVLKEKPGSRFVMEKVLETLAGRKIDFLFIDGWHGGEYARADFDTYQPLLSENALVICDDIYGAEDVTIFGMKKFWEELPGEKYLDPVIHGSYQMGFIRMGE